jgi:HK97 gp10 family phage protein
MAEAITVTGLREAQKALYSYSQQLGDRVVRGSLRQGANVVKRAAQENLTSQIKGPSTGRLRRGIVVRTSRIHRGKLSTDMIGVYLTVASKKKTDPYYGRFQEDGWRAGKTLVPGKKFIDKAFNDKKEAAVTVIVKAATSAAELLAKKFGL